jgi:hypothetical protein
MVCGSYRSECLDLFQAILTTSVTYRWEFFVRLDIPKFTSFTSLILFVCFVFAGDSSCNWSAVYSGLSLHSEAPSNCSELSGMLILFFISCSLFSETNPSSLHPFIYCVIVLLYHCNILSVMWSKNIVSKLTVIMRSFPKPYPYCTTVDSWQCSKHTATTSWKKWCKLRWLSVNSA